MALAPSFTTGSLGSPAQMATDVQVAAPPSDTISSLNFTPAQNQNLLVATSWSGQVQCWDTALQGATPVSQPKAEQRHELALDSAWFHDGSKVATCGGDRVVRVWDLGSNKQVQLGTHDGPVRACCVLDPQVGGGNIVASGAVLPLQFELMPRALFATELTCVQQAAPRVYFCVRAAACLCRGGAHAGHQFLAHSLTRTNVGGWDKKLKYWDLSSQRAVGEVTLEEKVYAMDAREMLLIVATADQPAAAANGVQATASSQSKQNSDRCRKIWCFDLRKPSAPVKVELSPLSYQTRCVAAFPGNAGYLVGSIEGRVGVQNFEGMHPDKQPSYTFKCHRRNLDVNGNVTQGVKVRPFLLWYPCACPPRQASVPSAGRARCLGVASSSAVALAPVVHAHCALKQGVMRCAT